MSPLPTQMANHWWQRPGRLPGRMLYQWHLAFHYQPQVIELVEMAQARLKGLPGLDMVAPHLLHLTTLIVGFADEIPDSTVEKIVSGARERLARSGSRSRRTDRSPSQFPFAVPADGVGLRTLPLGDRSIGTEEVPVRGGSAGQSWGHHGLGRPDDTVKRHRPRMRNQRSKRLVSPTGFEPVFPD